MVKQHQRKQRSH